VRKVKQRCQRPAITITVPGPGVLQVAPTAADHLHADRRHAEEQHEDDHHRAQGQEEMNAA
jgi:hypothetical protein